MNAPTETTALVTIETIKAVDLFKPGGVALVLQEVRLKVDALNTFDPATSEGRAAIKSLAYKIARTKTGLDDLGKEHVAELKRQAGVIDADRKTIRDTLDALRDEVRKPVDEWEAAEEARIADQAARLDAMAKLDQFTGEASHLEICDRFKSLGQLMERPFDEDFAERATQLIERIRANLTALDQAALRREAERAELERLRAAEVERKAKEDAEATAKAQAEREAQIRAEAEAAAKRQAEDAERRAQESEEARKRAEAEAERQAQEAAARAVEEEKRRQEAAAAAEREAALQRERNAAHRKKINNAAVSALMTHAQLSQEAAKAVVTAIAKAQIPHITISY